MEAIGTEHDDENLRANMYIDIINIWYRNKTLDTCLDQV